MSQSVSRPPLNAEARVPSQVIPRENCGVQNGTGTGFSHRVRWLFHVIIIHPMLHAHLHQHVALSGETNPETKNR